VASLVETKVSDAVEIWSRDEGGSPVATTEVVEA
jgi:hypothetical protein